MEKSKVDMSHYLIAKMPERMIEKAPVTLKVWIKDGRMRRIEISQGRFIWKKGKKRIKLTWEKLAKLIED